MIRRKALRLAVSAIVAMAAAPRLQAQSTSKIAWVSPSTAGESLLFFDALRNGLREFGHVEGRNLQLTAYWGDGSVAMLDKRAEEATSARPDVIVSQGNAVFAVRKYSGNIPVVFGYSGDPVLAGLVQSLARPGGSMTGMSYMALDLVGKRMQLLKEALPHARRVGVISFPQHPGDSVERRVSEVAASSTGVALEFVESRTAGELDAALSRLEAQRLDALMLFPTQTVMAARARIAEWSLRTRVPTISGWAQFADGGNFLAFGPSLRAANHRLAYFVDRILKGAKPSELPVELPLQLELVVNQRTARALGIVVPKALLLRADRVIE